MARSLSDPEIQELFSEVPGLYDRTVQHDQFVTANGWSQVAWALREDLPIPVRGTAVNAPLGTVILFPDASGILHYILMETAQDKSLANEVQKPTYESPTPGLIEELNALLGKVGDLVPFATMALIGVGALWLYQTLKK